MSNKPSQPITAAPKYLNDFSKALASEVRILLQEVGQLRDERRMLQYEIAQLMNVKSQHGPGGQFAVGWQPAPPPDPTPAPAELPAPEAPAAPAEPVKPAWRVVHQPRKIEGRKAKMQRQAQEQQALPPPPPPEPVKNVPAWATWKPNPLAAAPPVAKPPPITMPPRMPGLFGPVTPPPK